MFMFRLIVSALMSCMLSIAYAFSEQDIPDKFSVKNVECNTAGCVEILQNNKKIGDLYHAHFKSGTFYLTDSAHKKQLTFKFRGSFTFRTNLYFDVYDNQNKQVAKLMIENDDTINYVETVYEKDGTTVLASVSAGLLGTRQTVYDKSGKEPLAEIIRPLLSLSTDSDIAFINKSKALSDIDPNVFIGSLALYCTHFGHIYPADDTPISPQLIQHLKTNLQILADAQGLVIDDASTSAPSIQAAGDILTRRYEQENGVSYFNDDVALSNQDKLVQLMDLGQKLISSHEFSVPVEQAILQYLLLQLKQP